nr:hypothetical protein TetV2_00642 [Oceanusvirus sp.]
MTPIPLLTPTGSPAVPPPTPKADRRLYRLTPRGKLSQKRLLESFAEAAKNDSGITADSSKR